MTSAQIWALGIFCAIVLAVSVGLWPASRKLDGNRGASNSPFASLMAFLSGSAASAEASTDTSEGGGGGEAGGDGGGGGD